METDKKISPAVQVVLDILEDERKGNVQEALSKMSPKYSMTWMYKGKRELFPRSKPDFNAEMSAAYRIKGRKYDIKHIAEGEGVVMVELIESYPDLRTKKVYRTPLVLVLEIEQGKIKKGRHYCDPAISYMNLSAAAIAKAFK